MKVSTARCLTANPSAASRTVARFWDKISTAWSEVWGPHIHHGYYENSENLPPLAAQERLLEKLIEFAALTPRRKILDVGCGIGGTSLYLARYFQADVNGITLSPKQVEIAERRAKAAGIGNADFRLEDALSMRSFEDGTFDVVWSLESCEQFYNKYLFLEHAHRVLKPGGKLLLATWCSSAEEYVNSEARAYIKLCKAFDLPYMPTMSFYGSALKATGFKLEKKADWTHNVEKSWSEGIKAAGKKSFLYFLQRGGIRTLKFVNQLTLMERAYRERRIRYGIFLAVK